MPIIVPQNNNSNTQSTQANNTMTNESVVSDTLVVDPKASAAFVNPNKVIPVAQGSQNIEDMSEAEAILNASIQARPLMMPEGLNITILRKEYSYRWVAFKARGGENLSKFQYMGFEKATLQDVTPHSTKAATNPDGIIIGDLLLMKIPKELYFAHLKENYRRANIAATRMGQAAIDTERIRGEFPNGIPRGADGQPLGSFYKPGEQEVSSKLAAQINLNV